MYTIEREGNETTSKTYLLLMGITDKVVGVINAVHVYTVAILLILVEQSSLMSHVFQHM